jgi:hypothetical protein
MNGPIAQCVALVCHANAVLAGKRGLYFHGNSTARFCDSIEFAEPAPGGEAQVLADSPDAWFALLAHEGVSGLRLSRAPQGRPLLSDRMSAGFVGGGETWTIATIGADGQSDSWQAYWSIWSRKAPEQRIWRVTYVRDGALALDEPDTFAAARAELAEALDDIHAFAERNKCEGFVEAFAAARSVLAGTAGAERGYHRDLAPDGVLGADALAVLDGCQHASVFGGMGSWNDQSFDRAEGEAYERVSERLYRAVNRAIAAAANESFRRN